MKIACNVCESAEAVVLCCADEAALCWPCDQKVHAANKLASKHQRVALISNSNSNSHLPNCDICQEAAGYFFCLEDRALLCRKCDVSIHTINSLVSSHQRFLLTGVKVALDQAASNSSDKIAEPERSRTKMPPFTGGSYGDSVQQWQLDDFLALTDFNQEYNYLANGSSKGDSGKLAESPMVGAIDVVADCLGHVPEASWAVPEMCSPPTASGLCWSKTSPHHQCRLGCDTFVLDVCCLPTPKRRRDF